MIDDIKKDVANRMAKSVEALGDNLAKVRTGRAHPSLLDHLTVSYYGSEVPLKQVANVHLGPEIRRGLADWNGMVETVGGVVVVRSGADTLSTIARVKERLAELEAGLDNILASPKNEGRL